MSVRVPSIFDLIPSSELRNLGIVGRKDPRIRLIFTPRRSGGLVFSCEPHRSEQLIDVYQKLGLASISHLLAKDAVTELSVGARGSVQLLINGEEQRANNNAFARSILFDHRVGGYNLQQRAQCLEREYARIATIPLSNVQERMDFALKEYIELARAVGLPAHHPANVNLRAICKHCGMHVGDSGSPVIQIFLLGKCTEYEFAPTWLKVLRLAHVRMINEHFPRIVEEELERRIQTVVKRKAPFIFPPRNEDFD